jgi:hypothetical protein
MWADDVNKAGGIAGRKIELITCDDAARPEKAVSCARDLFSKKPVFLLNNSLTASILAVSPLVKDGPVMIVPSPNVTPSADSYVFQVSPSDLFLTAAIADFLKANGINKIGMVAATDASGEVGVASAKFVAHRPARNRRLDAAGIRRDRRRQDYLLVLFRGRRCHGGQELSQSRPQAAAHCELCQPQRSIRVGAEGR